jgi:hypothetical protein
MPRSELFLVVYGEVHLNQDMPRLSRAGTRAFAPLGADRLVIDAHLPKGRPTIVMRPVSSKGAFGIESWHPGMRSSDGFIVLEVDADGPTVWVVQDNDDPMRWAVIHRDYDGRAKRGAAERQALIGEWKRATPA